MNISPQQKDPLIRDIHLVQTTDNKTEEDPRWVAVLSNGLNVFEDRSMVPNSWILLKEFCRLNDLYIRDFKLEFRSHHEQIHPLNAAGYFFCYGIYGIIGENRSYNQYVVGVLENPEDKWVHITKWLVPELIIVETDTRNVKDCEDLLIRN